MNEQNRSLVVVADIAGGEEPARVARRLTDALSRSGVRPERIAMWPKTNTADLWALPATEVRAVLARLIDPDSATEGGDR
ncbi:hypothetical protein [Nocardia sp. NPDC050406]|uniref:hypothetical protein n=1 Tax=Nocardia sp. NPDC050406 TaxID=3364318 RepID=UPI0037AB20D9